MKKNLFPLIMKITAALTAALTALFAALFHFFGWQFCLSAAISTGVTFYHFGMRLLVGFLVSAAAGDHFDYRSPWFQSHAWEPALYRSLHLRRWKKLLPTYDPSQYDLTHNTLHQIICHTCVAEIVHEIIMVLSFFPMVLIPVFGEPAVFLITSVISALFDSFFVMAQRYNRPRLIRIYEKQEVSSL